MTNFLSGVAVVLSLLSLLLGSFATYQVLGLQNEVSDLASATSSTADSDQTRIASTPSSAESSSPDTSATETATGTEIQPKQFVAPAFKTIGEVELLSVKRIQDPETGKQDVVNVQFRVRRLSSDSPPVLNQILSPNQVAARNPETSETYEPVDLKRATDPILINLVNVNASVDGYVWLKIPEGVNTIDLFFPETQAFKNVPIN